MWIGEQNPKGKRYWRKREGPEKLRTLNPVALKEIGDPVALKEIGV